MTTVVGTVAFDTLALVKALPGPESTGGIQDVHPDLPGGTAGNVAMALARLGAPARLLAAVGADFAGTQYESILHASGIDLGGLIRDARATARAYVFVDPEGRQVTYFYGGAGAGLKQAPAPHVARAHFAAGEISEYPRLMRACQWVSFDPGQETFHRDLEEILACLPHVDLLFLNRHELARLTATRGLDAGALLDLGIEMLVETRGPEGALVHTRGGVLAAPAVEAVVRDPTGAGDAHRAGFLHALARGADAATAARFAAVMGACVVERVGAQAGLPTLEEAEERYRSAFGARPTWQRQEK